MSPREDSGDNPDKTADEVVDTPTSDATPGDADTSDSEAAGSTHARYDQADGPRLSPALIATLVTIPIMVIVGFIAFAAMRSDDTSTPVDDYAADPAVSEQCSGFLEEIPARFEGFGPKQITGNTAIWLPEGDGDPLTVVCGVDRPTDLAPTSNLQVVNRVQWFITDTTEGVGQAYVAVDHRPYVAIWVPMNAGNGPITDVSSVIISDLESGPLQFGDVPTTDVPVESPAPTG